MGEEELVAAGFNAVKVVHRVLGDPAASDTVAAVRAFLQAGVDLIVFGGGDGTARATRRGRGHGQL